MTTRLAIALAATLGLAMPAYSQAATPATQAAQTANPFFAESPLPLHYPQFDKIKDSDFAPAFDAGMAEQLKEMDAIANNPAAPTFENTLVALEKTGELLGRVNQVFNGLTSANTNPALQRVRLHLAQRRGADDEQHRRSIQPGIGHGGDPVGKAWPGGDDAHAQFASRAGIGVGGVASGAFVAKIGQCNAFFDAAFQQRFQMPAVQREGAPDREGDADLASDRPADPPAVREGLQARGAGDLHRAEP